MFEWLRHNLYIHALIEGNIDAVNRMREVKQLQELQEQRIIKALESIKLAISKLEGPALELKPTSASDQRSWQKGDITDQLLQQIKEMADDIRQMDQLIFNMSQCSDWPSMRPHFLRAEALMMQRMKNESNRIGDLMRKELIKTYAPKLENITEAERKHLGVDE